MFGKRIQSFADHYQYTDKDINDLLELAGKKDAELITTEKDWMRLPNNVRQKIKYARLETEITPKFFVWLKEKLNANN